MQTDQAQEPGLPDDLAVELRLLAATETVGTRPFPGVDTAIRRRRVTRYGSGVALIGAVAAGVIAVEVVVGGVFDQTGQQGAPAAPSVTSSAASPEAAGYGAPAGALAADSAWWKGLQERIRALALKQEPETTITAADIRLVAADDIEDRARYAVVLIPGHRPGNDFLYWRREIWLGPAGAPPAKMDFQGGSGFELTVPTDLSADFFSVTDPEDTNDAVVVVVAPGARRVSITSSRRWLPDGRTPDQFRDLNPTGTAVWASTLTPDEYLLSEYTADGETGNSATGAPAPDFGAVAPPGTDRALLDELETGTRISSAMVPVFAGVQGDLVAGVLRSPDNGYLVKLSAVQKDHGTTNVWQFAEVTQQGFADVDAVMAAAKAPGAKHELLVLAPKGAVKVRAAGATAKVRNRLASLNSGASEVEALDARGKVIATVTVGVTDGPFGFPN